ncbi:conserved hypothetical protein, partial [Enhydrobacter aerosaccus]
MTKNALAALVGVMILAASGSIAQAQTQAPAQPAPPAQQTQPPAAAPAEKETWKGPFGGTFNANFAITTDYSYRGISQTQRNPAFQMGFGYETPQVSEKVPLSAYASLWGSNVSFPGTGASVEIDTVAGLRLKALNEKLLVDLSWMRYNYPGSTPDIGFIE